MCDGALPLPFGVNRNGSPSVSKLMRALVVKHPLVLSSLAPATFAPLFMRLCAVPAAVGRVRIIGTVYYQTLHDHICGEVVEHAMPLEHDY